MDKRFADKTVIVTGASSGIGAEAARRFAAEGARVVLAARRKEAMEAVAGSMAPDRRLIIPLDVTDTESAAGMLEQVQARFGRIDILVNNAGCHARGPVCEKETADLTRMVDVNLRAPIALCRMVLPYLKRVGGGAIVNVASLAGHVPFAGAAVYCATKFGLRMFSLSLAEELEGSGIRVSVVSPGPVDTEFFKGQIDDIAGLRVLVFHELGRAGRPSHPGVRLRRPPGTGDSPIQQMDRHGVLSQPADQARAQAIDDPDRQAQQEPIHSEDFTGSSITTGVMHGGE